MGEAHEGVDKNTFGPKGSRGKKVNKTKISDDLASLFEIKDYVFADMLSEISHC